MSGTDLKVVATNRQARRDYEIYDTIECGIMLRGAEVKALREARVTLRDTYARVLNGELWLLGLHIAPYRHASTHEVLDADRDRKLLVHRAELERLRPRVEQQGLTLVPLRLYFKGGRAKVELGVARGRRKGDRRQEIAKRDADREAARAMSQARRGAGPGS